MNLQAVLQQDSAVAVLAEQAFDVPAREALLDRAMGPGRKKKSSEKLRRGRRPAKGLALVARTPKGLFWVRCASGMFAWGKAVRRRCCWARLRSSLQSNLRGLARS